MKQIAYEAARLAYCRKLCGMAPPGATVYEGGFDVDSLVEDAPRPKNNTLREHQASWAEFRRMFNQRWAEFESETA